MKKSLIWIGVLVLFLAVTEVASAHPRRGGGFRSALRRQFAPAPPIRYYGNNFGGRTTYSRRSSRTWFGANYGNYGGDYFGGHSSALQPSYSYYAAGAPVVVVKPPKPRPDVAIVSHTEDGLEATAASKFCAVRHLSEKDNRVELTLVSRDFHSDTGALKKVKFKVSWVEIKTKKTKDKDGKEVEVREEEQKDTTVKLKFDEYGRFTDYDD